MRFTNLKYGRKITNIEKESISQYGNEYFEAEAIIHEGDQADAAAELLVKFVDSILGLGEKPTPKQEVAPKKEESTYKKEEVKEEEAPKKEKKAKKDAPKKEKKVDPNTIYDRDVKEHKRQMGSTLTEICPEWKELGIGKAISESLEGSEMFKGSTGEVLESFKQLIAKKVKELTDADL